jgi:hypothetical protein
MTSIDGGRKMGVNRAQFVNAPEQIYQHSDGNSNVTRQSDSELWNVELWICLTDAGIVIAARDLECENASEFNCQRDE